MTTKTAPNYLTSEKYDRLVSELGNRIIAENELANSPTLPDRRRRAAIRKEAFTEALMMVRFHAVA